MRCKNLAVAGCMIQECSSLMLHAVWMWTIWISDDIWTYLDHLVAQWAKQFQAARCSLSDQSDRCHTWQTKTARHEDTSAGQAHLEECCHGFLVGFLRPKEGHEIFFCTETAVVTTDHPGKIYTHHERRVVSQHVLPRSSKIQLEAQFASR